MRKKKIKKLLSSLPFLIATNIFLLRIIRSEFAFSSDIQHATVNRTVRFFFFFFFFFYTRASYYISFLGYVSFFYFFLFKFPTVLLGLKNAYGQRVSDF